jgi:hypothetical protein
MELESQLVAHRWLWKCMAQELVFSTLNIIIIIIIIIIRFTKNESN